MVTSFRLRSMLFEHVIIKIFENDSVNRPTFEILKSLANLPLFSRVYITVIKDFFYCLKWHYIHCTKGTFKSVNKHIDF